MLLSGLIIMKKIEIQNHLIDVMGVNLETGQMKPDGPVGVKPRPFNVDSCC